MAEKKVTCIICPIGCEILVKGEGERIDSLEGQACKRGEQYARDEFIHPVRILTSSVLVSGGESPLVPVRSSKPVPKERMLDCMEQIRALSVSTPVHRGDVLIADLLGLGVDIVATGEA